MVMATGAPMTGQAQDMKGATAITMKDRRWKRCSIKSVSLLGNLMGFDHARAGGAHDAIQINEDGYVTEACAANIFVVREGRIMTPPLSENILPGVTRALVLSVAQEDSRYACEETAVTLSDLQQAEEIWLTSSTKEIRPIVSLDGVTVGSGEPGPVWRHIAPLFCARRDAVSS
ncbi:MAG: aminotransferase class IV, partial [Kistimonas sp.]|nr:aminotransferase class IV [Kistimonas sp.]